MSGKDPVESLLKHACRLVIRLFKFRLIIILTQALQGSAASVRQVVRVPETHWLLASSLTASGGPARQL